MKMGPPRNICTHILWPRNGNNLSIYQWMNGFTRVINMYTMEYYLGLDKSKTKQLFHCDSMDESREHHA